MMTRKDYVATAEILNNCDLWVSDPNAVFDLALEFSKMFASDNANFDKDRFLDAVCKI
jgi:hypothetical protein